MTVDGVLLAAWNDLRNHSPGGFSWGYAGSGPSQLASASSPTIFIKRATAPSWPTLTALALYHDFKLITPLQGDWQFNTHVVADTVNMVVKRASATLFPPRRCSLRWRPSAWFGISTSVTDRPSHPKPMRSKDAR